MRGLFKVPFHDDEAFTSMWSRLGRANGRSAMSFSLDMGIRMGSLAAGDEKSLLKAAAVAGIDLGTATSRSLIQKEGGVTMVGGHRFTAGGLVRTCSRYCPKCLMEDDLTSDRNPQARRYFRLRWHVRAVRSCEVHGCSLVEAGQPSNPNHRYDFPSLMLAYPDLVRETSKQSMLLKFTAFERFVCDRLDGQAGHGDFLDDLPLRTAIDLCEEVGICLTKGKTFTGEDGFSPSGWSAVAQTGYELLEQGYGGFDEALGRIVGDASKYTPSAGGYALFGRLYKAVRAFDAHEDYRLPVKLMREYALRNVRLTSRALIFGELTEARLVSLMTFTKKHEVHYSTFRKLFKHLGYEGVEMNREGTKASLIDVDLAEKTLVFWRSLVTAAECERILDVHTQTMEIILDAGFLVPVLPRQKDNRYARYALRDVEGFRDKVLPVVPDQNVVGLVAFGSAVKRARTVQSEAFALLLEGKLTRRGQDPNKPRGIRGLLLDPKELARAVEERTQSTLPVEDVVSSEEAAERIGVPVRAVRRLAQLGHLPNLRLTKPFSKARNYKPGFSATDVEAFRERYIPVTEIAKTARMTPSSVWRLVRKAAPHIQVVFTGKDVGIFYSRSETEAVGLFAAAG